MLAGAARGFHAKRKTITERSVSPPVPVLWLRVLDNSASIIWARRSRFTSAPTAGWPDVWCWLWCSCTNRRTVPILASARTNRRRERQSNIICSLQGRRAATRLWPCRRQQQNRKRRVARSSSRTCGKTLSPCRSRSRGPTPSLNASRKRRRSSVARRQRRCQHRHHVFPDTTVRERRRGGAKIRPMQRTHLVKRGQPLASTARRFAIRRVDRKSVV